MTNTTPKTYVELILDDEKLTQAEKIQRINYVYNNYQEKLDEDLRNYLIKIWSGGLLEIASAAIPFGGAGKLGAAGRTKIASKIYRPQTFTGNRSGCRFRFGFRWGIWNRQRSD